ncbi:hypothetical protein Spica_2468 [Gracilinema caldarium DSM 7334]|uniref:Uncharacterized protein n=1 Tax=Gracilinema caldarium (strain ATCC 51460 / DSM 7334 / H1) TaxID=744872 RepID=F8F4C6_GRAC1|nr:hypothetical protein Spica_2468 [Gracilinema caldarium DSM 7334]
MPGIVTSPVEVVQISKFGLWLAVREEEYFLDFSFRFVLKAAFTALFLNYPGCLLLS